MRIAYLTEYDPNEVQHWSGTGFYIMRCLVQQGFAVEPVGPIPWRSSPAALRGAVKYVFYNHLLGERWGHYNRYLDPVLMRSWARQFQSRLYGKRFDLIVSPGTHRVSYVDCNIPMITWADATFAGLLENHNTVRPLCRENIWGGHLLESRALRKATLAIFSSEWAADSALRQYHLAPDKTRVVPFGANLSVAPTAARVAEFIQRRSRQRLELLFIGVHFDAKGGPAAIEVARRLNASGIPTRLTIAGCSPEVQDQFIEVAGFISKSDAGGEARMEELLARSHFLILPTKADCFGIALCEANAFGVPCVAPRLGGIQSVVRDGINGQLFQPPLDPQMAAQWIGSKFRDWSAYSALARASFKEYVHRLNWEVSGEKFVEAVRSICPGASSFQSMRRAIQG